MRWKEAMGFGVAPRIVPEATNGKVLDGFGLRKGDLELYYSRNSEL